MIPRVGAPLSFALMLGAVLVALVALWLAVQDDDFTPLQSVAVELVGEVDPPGVLLSDGRTAQIMLSTCTERAVAVDVTMVWTSFAHNSVLGPAARIDLEGCQDTELAIVLPSEGQLQPGTWRLMLTIVAQEPGGSGQQSIRRSTQAIEVPDGPALD